MSEYHLDLWTWLNSAQMRKPTGSRWVSNNYITRCHRRLGSVAVRIAVPVGDKMPEWELAPDRGSTVEQPGRMRKKCFYGQKNFGSICSSLFPSSFHLSHTTNINPFANKVWEVYFIKELCSFIEVVIMFLLTSACIWVYNNRIRCYHTRCE